MATAAGRLGLWPQLFSDLRIDPFSVGAAMILGDLLLEPRDRLTGCFGGGFAEMVARSRGEIVGHAVDSARLPV